MISLISVTSGKIRAIGYDADEFTLYVLFPPSKQKPHGSLYSYQDVAPEQHEEMVKAESIGKWFGANLQHNRDHQLEQITIASDGFITLDGQAFPPGASLDGDVAEVSTTPSQSIEQQPALALTQVSDDEPLPDTAAELMRFAEQARDAVRTLTTAGVLKGVVVIRTPTEYSLVGSQAMKLKGILKATIAKLEPAIQEKFRAHRQAVAERNSATSPLEEAIRMVDQGMADYRRAEEQAAAARQRAADAEARAQAEAEAKRLTDRRAIELAKQYEAQGNQEQAALALANPVPVLPVVRATETVHVANIPQVEGQSVRRQWKARIVDAARIPLSHDFYTLDESKLDAYAKRLGVHAKVDGVEFYEMEITSRRARA
jgi:exonuclease VII small subunit